MIQTALMVRALQSDVVLICVYPCGQICHQCKLPRLGEALLDAEVNSEGAWVRVSMESGA